MNKNTCPLCRRAMRLWAMDARHAPSPELSDICVRTAISFRDECLCTPQMYAERYEQLTAQLVAAMRRTKESHLTPTELYEASAAIRAEIEKIKNRFGGSVPAMKEAA